MGGGRERKRGREGQNWSRVAVSRKAQRIVSQLEFNHRKMIVTADKHDDISMEPKAPDNGCCLLCCGKAPGATRVGAITADGGRWLQHADGRLGGYFLHGSDS